MDLVEIIAEVLKYVVPAALVLIGMRYVSEAEQRRKNSEQRHRLREEVLRQHLPLKLAAHERAILFLERISPSALLTRSSGSGKSVEDFRRELIAQIRSEYEHNLVQQLYISAQGWALLQQGKEEIIALIHQTAQAVQNEGDGSLLARKVLEQAAERNDMMYQKAIYVIKEEVLQYFRIQEES